MITNYLFPGSSLVGIKEVCIIGEGFRRKHLRRELSKEFPHLAVREFDNHLCVANIGGEIFTSDTKQAVVIFSGQWRELYNKLTAAGFTNCYLYFKYGDDLIFPPAPKFHIFKTAFWLIGELACRRIKSRKECKLLKTVALWGYAGYFHDISLTKHHTTFSVSGPRKNPAFRDLSYQFILWDCIKQNLTFDLAGKRVVDIGCAEGFFSFQANRYGAKVVSINPPTNSLFCFKAILQHLDLSKKIHILSGYYPEIGKSEISHADVVFFLGALHHFTNLEEALAPILLAQKVLVLEAVFYSSPTSSSETEGIQRFNPTSHAQNDKRICPKWLVDYLKQHQYTFSWIDAWQRFVDLPGNNTFSYDVYSNDSKQSNMRPRKQNRSNATRRLLIAEPLGVGNSLHNP